MLGPSPAAAMDIDFRPYSEDYLPAIAALLEKDLSEPYSVFTYHYMLHNHGHLCRTAWLRESPAADGSDSPLATARLVGVILGRVALHVCAQTWNTSFVNPEETFMRATGDSINAPDVYSSRSAPQLAPAVRTRGYIGMLAVSDDCRRRGLGRRLVQQIVQRMVAIDNVDEIVLETETSNNASLQLYASLGFVRDKRLSHYYLNGSDAFRLKLWLRAPPMEA